VYNNSRYGGKFMDELKDINFVTNKKELNKIIYALKSLYNEEEVLINISKNTPEHFARMKEKQLTDNLIKKIDKLMR
jgi:hypothetical protein